MTGAKRECGFCGTPYGGGAAACPKCAYPADGVFRERGAAAPPPSAAGAAKQSVRTAKRTASDVCRHCGASFPAGRTACPECGSDERTGWTSDEAYDHALADIPEADDDAYRRALSAENPGDVSLWSSRQFRILVIGLILLAAMVVPLVIALRHLP